MNMMNHFRAAIHTFHKPTGSIATIFSATALALVLGLFAGAGKSYAQLSFTWTNGNDVWTSPTAWVTNSGGGTGGWPDLVVPDEDGLDTAWFTNAATYYVTLSDADEYIASNIFANASGTAATVTLDMGAHQMYLIDDGGGDKQARFTVGSKSESVTTVYLAYDGYTNSDNGLVGGLAGKVSATVVEIGSNGVGTRQLATNGMVSVGAVNIGGRSGGQGTLGDQRPRYSFSIRQRFGRVLGRQRPEQLPGTR